MQKNTIIAVFLFLLMSSCKKENTILQAKKTISLVSYVNPFIGTGGHGHTYPGATMPFGMMQLSPDTRLDGWDGCSGYHYSDSIIYGFTHTHLSGTGVSDYGDILLMPTNNVVFNNGANGKRGYASTFSHKNEIATPGYYKVHLDDTNIDVELTVSKRSGKHKYTFKKGEKQVVILDLKHRDKVLDSELELLSKTQVTGYRSSESWASKQYVYFNLSFSKPYTKVTLLNQQKKGKNVVAAFEFDTTTGNTLEVAIGISAVDKKGAEKNRVQEIGNLSFDELKNKAQNTWEKQLEKIIVESIDSDYLSNFYTALYHTMIAPNLYQDVDGRYRGMDLKIHQTKDFNYYTVFSLWDTFRAAHPLYTIIEQERTNDFINTFLAKNDEGGILPIWDLSANYTGCMIGYHAVPVIVDAYLKGIKKYDVEKAFTAIQHSATRDKLGLDSYKKYGFIPVEKESESVSKTLEYAYDDWTIAQMAKSLGKEKEYKTYIERAQNYKNIFDPSSQFMRGRFRNTWFSPFNPSEVNFNYTEANSWQYSFYVPQDISGFMQLLGGKKGLENQLDKLFVASTETAGRQQVDITGLIGQYAHGNEPSHHMAYLYNFVNKPYKTQEKIRQILTTLYTNTPDGISGNEDCGQMSAWYVFSSLGFYPVTPASNQYIIGNPLFKKATINLENGKQFTVVAHHLSKKNKYIKTASLNGEELNRTYIAHNEIVKGGVLEFIMTDIPSKWGTKIGQEPTTTIDEHLIVAAPFIAKGEVAFKNTTTITLQSVNKKAKIYYSFTDKFKEYTAPFQLLKKARLKVYAQVGTVKSAIITTHFFKINPNLKISLQNKYANEYNAGGENALIDGILGAEDFRTGTWQGYQGKDMIATIDISNQQLVKEVTIGFLQDQKSWIFYPTEVSCFVSADGKNFTSVGKQQINATLQKKGVEVRRIKFNVGNKKVRYIKIKAKKLEALPKWHLGYGSNGKSWIFTDEIEIK